MNLLNRDGQASIPKGYQHINTERKFLEHIISDKDLFITSEKLCDWAILILQGRGKNYKEVTSVFSTLQNAFPELTLDECKTIVDHLGEDFFLDNSVTTEKIIQAYYPMTLWDQAPSEKHAAQWLIWIYSNEITPTLWKIVKRKLEEWQLISNPTLSWMYLADSKELAIARIHHWLGVNIDPQYKYAGKFPINIPNPLVDDLRTNWRQKIIESKGEISESLLSGQLVPQLKQIIAKETAEFFIHNHQFLNTNHISLLSQFTELDIQEKLWKCLPPKEPSLLPESPEEVLNWFVQEYLPYRLSNLNNNNETITSLSQKFGEWYLQQYPKALHGFPTEKFISFKKAAAYSNELDQSTIALMIILDGLHVGDGQRITQMILSKCPRLTITQSDYAFAPLPTVTQFSKETLFKGVSYINCEGIEPIGKIIPENKTPLALLENSESGEVYIWRVLEPDKTYHSHNSNETLKQDVESQLDGIARKIQEIVDKVDENKKLEIIITTDHGRLISYSDRSIEIPKGFTAHGRAAWGNLKLAFDDSGYIIDGEVAYISPTQFGLEQVTAIILSDKCFKTNDGKTGTEAFPHGGIFPEEVIIPWLSFSRDIAIPLLSSKLSGTNQAQKPGIAELAITNLSDSIVLAKSIILTVDSEKYIDLPLDVQISKRNSGSIKVEIDPWPSENVIQKTSAFLKMQLMNGYSFESEVTLQLKSTGMYQRDNVLEGLE
jgi:hypothetical protein